MEKTILSPIAGTPHRIKALCLVAAFAAMIGSGCTAARKRPAIPWNTAILVRPLVPKVQAASVDPDAVPDLQPTLPALPAKIAGGRSGPARPRVATPSPAESEANSKGGTLFIVPQLSTQDTAASQQQTNQSLAVAERNLASANGKTLNATQTDLVSKVRSFMNDARASARLNDWPRAKTLAKKAEVLSEELAASF